MRKGFHDPYRNDGHVERLQGEGLSQQHPVFLQLAPMLVGSPSRQAQYGRRYWPKAKLVRQSSWGSKGGGSSTAGAAVG